MKYRYMRKTFESPIPNTDAEAEIYRTKVTSQFDNLGTLGWELIHYSPHMIGNNELAFTIWKMTYK